MMDWLPELLGLTTGSVVSLCIYLVINQREDLKQIRKELGQDRFTIAKLQAENYHLRKDIF